MYIQQSVTRTPAKRLAPGQGEPSAADGCGSRAGGRRGGRPVGARPRGRGALAARRHRDRLARGDRALEVAPAHLAVELAADHEGERGEVEPGHEDEEGAEDAVELVDPAVEDD